MKKFLKNILGKLPFDGWKSALGFIGLVVAPHLPAIALFTIPGLGVVTLPAFLAGLATTYGTAGIVHKTVK